jgi:hypothetical protein
MDAKHFSKESLKLKSFTVRTMLLSNKIKEIAVSL